jgi:two-component system cell cycle response regulator
MINAKKQSNKKILIADDDLGSRRILRKFLTKWDYEVIEVADGTAALAVLEADDAPRLAVLDWMMPGAEGVEICRAIRARASRPYIYLLLLTARSEKQDLLDGLRLGADDYLVKPLDAQELQARLHVGERILALQDDLIEAKEELRFKATHDGLTGIANRGVALDAVQHEHLRQLRESKPFGVILADLDHFKHINDTYGHLAGDAVLKEAARRMVASSRAYDTVGRYGGEEFLVVAPGADLAIALRLAERMRNVIVDKPFLTEAGEIMVTASFGVASSHDAAMTDPKSLVEWADEALYRAKRRGRNRSESSEISVRVDFTSEAAT